jgi:rhodanese-related sulfurtransferase
MKTIKEIDIEELNIMKSYQKTIIVDVRETEEFEIFNIGGINIPAHLLPNNYELLDTYANVIIVCSNGLRSSIVARVLLKKLPNTAIFHLTEGIQ